MKNSQKWLGWGNLSGLSFWQRTSLDRVEKEQVETDELLDFTGL
jgi:hypothetical protein